MAKKTNQGIYIMVGIIVAALIIAPNLDIDFFSTTNVDQITQDALDNEKEGTCIISLNKNVIDAGDSITGSVKDGVNTVCSLYGNLDDTGWIKIGEAVTDSLGEMTIVDTLSVPGTFMFRAICGDCISNIVNLKVNPVASIDCTDTDGINKMTAGWVTYDGLYYYDSCVDDVVTEYYCDGSGVQTRILPCDIGYECFFTRSGAYCDLIGEEPPIDSDGDGFSDEEEELEGTNPNDSNSYPGGPAEACADECNAIGFAGSYYDPISSENGCMGYGYDTCFPVFGLQFEDSTYIDECCCFRCVGW